MRYFTRKLELVSYTPWMIADPPTPQGPLMPHLCDLSLISTFASIMINHSIPWIKTHLFFSLFLRKCPIIFGWRVWRMSIIFKWQKFSLRVLLNICLIFSQFLPGVAYKIVDYIKKRVAYWLLAYRLLISFPNTDLEDLLSADRGWCLLNYSFLED